MKFYQLVLAILLIVSLVFGAFYVHVNSLVEYEENIKTLKRSGNIYDDTSLDCYWIDIYGETLLTGQKDECKIVSSYYDYISPGDAIDMLGLNK